MDSSKAVLAAWKIWKQSWHFHCYSTSLTPFHSQNFGQYFINFWLKKGYNNPEIFYETNNERAYTKLMLLAASEELDKWLLDEYTDKTNQTRGA